MWQHFMPAHIFPLGILLVGVLGVYSLGLLETMPTCGKPVIQNIMNNITVGLGESATFNCQVDMRCIVAYIEWYHEMDNGTERLIKSASSPGDPHIYYIEKVKPTDKGVYTCLAGNVQGQAAESCYLMVNSVGTFSRPSENLLSNLFVIANIIILYSSVSL